MRIAVDAMGGDFAPAEIVKGCVEALDRADAEIVLVGREEAIRAEFEKLKFKPDGNIIILDAREVIDSDESPVRAVRHKRDSSIVKCINMVRDGQADAMLSAGNTGALMSAALLYLGRIEGIERPAIVSAYPLLGRKGRFALLVDSGANAECKPSNLLGFAYMGSIYMSSAFGVKNPKVGLINIGTERNKGTALLKDSFMLLENSAVNFIGNIEARDIPKTEADVLVCDGYTGNIVLKLTEGVAWNILKLIKEKMTESLTSKFAALPFAAKLKSLKKDFDYSTYGGAP
ncbi:MAG: phosphate acyltransferase PlsX, partial [Clostridiales bacterium]|nr:phosphate acyltransferase PlsX [Clostridiales bacterium]